MTVDWRIPDCGSWPYLDIIGCGVPTILSFALVITLTSTSDAPSFDSLFTRPYGGTCAETQTLLPSSERQCSHANVPAGVVIDSAPTLVPLLRMSGVILCSEPPCPGSSSGAPPPICMITFEVSSVVPSNEYRDLITKELSGLLGLGMAISIQYASLPPSVSLPSRKISICDFSPDLDCVSYD